MHARETFFKQKVHIFENVNWLDHPLERGFWTDEEMFEQTGTGSTLLVKAMTGAKLVEFSKYRKSNGRLARAWSENDLYLAALINEFSDYTGFNQLAVIEIMKAIPRELIDRYLDLDAPTQKGVSILDQLAEMYMKVEEAAKEGLHDEIENFGIMELFANRVDQLNFVILNRQYIGYREIDKNEKAIFFAEIENPDTKKPSILKIDKFLFDGEFKTEIVVYIQNMGLKALVKKFPFPVRIKYG